MSACVVMEDYLAFLAKSPMSNFHYRVDFTSPRTRTGWFGVSMTGNATTISVVSFSNLTGSYVFEVNGLLEGNVSLSSENQTLNSFVQSDLDHRLFGLANFVFDVPVEFVKNPFAISFISNEIQKNPSLESLSPALRTTTRTVSVFNDTTICTYERLNVQIRLDIEFWGFWVATEAWLIFCLALSIIYYNLEFQPALSRSITPIVTLVSYALGSFSIFLLSHIVSVEWFQKYGCLVQMYFGGILYAVGYWTALLNFARYIIIININSSKQQYYSLEDERVKLKWYIRLLNWLARPFGATILTILVCGIPYVFYILVGISFNFACHRVQESFLNYGYLVFACVILALTGLLLVLDLILNWRKVLKCRIRDFCIKSDPYLFRIERWGIIGLVIGLAPLLGGFRASYLALSIIGVFLFHWLLVVQVYFVLGVTTINICISKCRKRGIRRELGLIETIFQDEALFEIFLEFSVNEWSFENLMFTKDIIKYKSIKNIDERSQFASLIVSKYLSGTESVMELNISSQTREACLANYKSEPKDGINVFSPVVDAVNENLLDIWQRFRFSPEYKKYKIRKEVENQL